MNKGIALIIGVGEVNTEHYDGWNGMLQQPENDAKMIADKINKYGFTNSLLLLTQEATRQNVIDRIQSMALLSCPSDLVFIYYSGHGGQVPARKSDMEEDNLNETWCLYDGQLIDNELYHLWAKFKAGVRIFVVSDSCHSGTITKAIIDTSDTNPVMVAKNLPDVKIKSVYSKNIDFYTEIYDKLDAEPMKDIEVPIMSFGGCQDDQCSYTLSKEKYSVFTTHFSKLLNAPSNNIPGASQGITYDEAIKRIQLAVKEDVGLLQTPYSYKVGKDISFSDEILLKI